MFALVGKDAWSVVGDVSFVASGVEIHYDLALRETAVLPLPPGMSPVAYAHVRYESMTATAA